jgi:hypothetical protein
VLGAIINITPFFLKNVAQLFLYSAVFIIKMCLYPSVSSQSLASFFGMEGVLLFLSRLFIYIHVLEFLWFLNMRFKGKLTSLYGNVNRNKFPSIATKIVSWLA